MNYQSGLLLMGRVYDHRLYIDCVDKLERAIEQLSVFVSPNSTACDSDVLNPFQANLDFIVAIRRRKYAVMPHERANQAAYCQFFVVCMQPALLHPSLPNIGADVAWLIAEYAYEPAQFVHSLKWTVE